MSGRSRVTNKFHPPEHFKRSCKSLGWPGDAGDSETLAGVVRKLDEECCRRCDEWDMSRANLPLSLLWTRFSFRFVRNLFPLYLGILCLFSRPERSKFVSKVLEMASANIHHFHLQDLLSYLLLVSYSSHSLLRQSWELIFKYFERFILFI